MSCVLVLFAIHESRVTNHGINGMGFFVFLMFNASRFTTYALRN